MLKTLAAVALGSLLLATGAAAQDAVLSDPLALRAPGRADDALPGGMLAAYEMRDGDAVVLLGRYLAGNPTEVLARRAAQTTLAVVHLRNGAYAEAAALLEAALADFPPDSDARRGIEQTLAVARTLVGAEPQVRASLTEGAVAFTRDLAGLPRVPLIINGQAREYVFDTGANLSVVMESEAAELGLEILGETAGVRSITETAAPARLALARTLTIGDLEFRNVVFLVMPDAGLTFAGGAYVIPGILGFPVISRMERVTVADGRVSWAPSAGPAAERDLFIDGLTPRVYGHVAGGPAVPFALDTGANQTSLRPVALDARPDLAAVAVAGTRAVGSAGGTRQVESRRLPSLTLRFDTVEVTLSGVDVAEESAGGEDVHGRLGQDVLSLGYVIDFPGGDFALKPPVESPR